MIAGVARIVVLQHCTFLINSACHTIGRQPYSTKCSARDSFFLALFTFGEGYHNYHHEFQYDYRNGVKPWQMDPTKWIIWMLSRLRLVRGLRRASADKIRSAQREMESESPARWVNAAQLHEEAPLPSGLQPALVFNLNLKGEPFD